MVSGRVSKTTLPARQIYRGFICESVVPAGQVKVDPPQIVHNLYSIMKWTDFPLSLRFSRLIDRNGFWWVNFHFFDTNFCLNLKFRHYVRLATPRVVPVRRVGKALTVYEQNREICSAFWGYPTSARRDNSPTRVFSPPPRLQAPSRS